MLMSSAQRESWIWGAGSLLLNFSIKALLSSRSLADLDMQEIFVLCHIGQLSPVYLAAGFRQSTGPPPFLISVDRVFTEGSPTQTLPEIAVMTASSVEVVLTSLNSMINRQAPSSP